MEDLQQYPRPSVAVDIAVLTVVDHKLCVLIQDRNVKPLGRALPGRFLRERELVKDCMTVALREKANLDPGTGEPQLLRVFDEPERDNRGWTLSLGHYLVLPPSRVARTTASLVEVSRATGLLFDHDRIVSEAASAMRLRYELAPDPDHLLTEPFTLAELRMLHEAVLGEPLQRDTFRRRMIPNLRPYLEHGVQASRVDRGRPARLWLPQAVDPLEAERLRLPRA